MIEGLDDILESSGQPELAELGEALRELLGVRAAKDWSIRLHRLASGAYRVRLEARVAQRNQLVTGRWLPAAGLGQARPALRGVAEERGGWHTWQRYSSGVKGRGNS